jgi:hypothetical protein
MEGNHMETVIVKDQGAHASLCGRITTSGLVSGYQRTNITTSGAAVIEFTDQSILIEMIPLPSFELPSFDDVCEIIWPKIQKPTKDELMAQGYKLLNAENVKLAEDLFSVDSDDWPSWEN